MAETLVMLPGMMCDERLFSHQIAGLDVEVMIPPLAGAESITELAEMILADLPHQFALAGLSMGGIVAMEILRQAPGRITRLALMDTNPFAETPERQQIRTQQIERVKAGGLRGVIRDDMKPHYLADTPGRAEILSLCMDMALGLGDAVFIEQSRMLAGRRDQTATLAEVKTPVLILHGAEDRLCPEEYHHAMHALIPHARLIAIEGAGHLPCLEKPPQVTAALTDWLAA